MREENGYRELSLKFATGIKDAKIEEKVRYICRGPKSREYVS